MGKDKEKLKIILVCSSGGHLAHLYMLKPIWEKYDRAWVCFNKQDARSILGKEKFYHCAFPTNRNFKNFWKNFFLAIKVIRKEKPDIIISSGAGVAVPFFWIGKLHRTKNIYIEVYDRIDTGTLSGKLCYPVSDLFIVQWDDMKKVYKKAINLGSIF
jgi:UDP-N-acetylglucosamine:LPS N-acetylglucosamine transferase